MKKLFAICLTAIILTGCASTDVKAKEVTGHAPDKQLMVTTQELYSSPNTNVVSYILVDQITGVNYIAFSTNSYDGGVTVIPRLNADGTLYTVSVS